MNALAQHRRELLIHHKAARQLYDTYKSVVNCLHNQRQEAIHVDYLAELEDHKVGLTNALQSAMY